MKEELTSLMHLEFLRGEEKISLAVHCWFQEVSAGGDPTYWLNRLEINRQDLIKYRGGWGNKWDEVDLDKIKFVEEELIEITHTGLKDAEDEDTESRVWTAEGTVKDELFTVEEACKLYRVTIEQYNKYKGTWKK